MVRRRAVWIGSLLALTLAGAVPTAAIGAASSAATDGVGGELLARLVLRNGGELLRQGEPTPLDFEVALHLAEWAVELAPGSADAWRMLAKVSAATEGIDERSSARLRQALAAVCRLDPADEAARLQLLTARIDEMPTVEARVDAYRTLLSENNRRQVGDAVAARLAFDLALLLYRSGQIDACGETLALAVALDPAFPAATEMAAGFFRHRTEDPAAEAELFIAAVLANPVNPLPLRVLASIALEHGAHASASRLLELVAASISPAESSLDSIVSDLALSLWGEGRAEEALLVLDRRRREAEVIERDARRIAAAAEDPAAAEQALQPPDPRPAAIAAVILSAMGDPAAAESREAAAAALLRVVQAASRGPAGAEAAAPILLDAASLELWLGGDPEAAQALLDRVPAEFEATPQRRRVAAWMALRRGDPEAALAGLEGLDEDPSAQLAGAVALEQLGRRGDAARSYLALFRGAPGSAIGLWSRGRLTRLLGREIPPPPEGAAIDALVASMPATFDRLMRQRTKAVSLTLRPRQERLLPLEPLRVDVEIANNTDLPLAISPSGPIEPNLALIAAATVAQLDRPVAMPPLVVSLAQRLRLGPRERMVVPVDLSASSFGAVLDRTLLSGSSVQVRGILNMRSATGGALQPGPLGDRAETPQIRVEGVRVGGPWVQETLAALRGAQGPASRGELADLLLLASVASAAELRREAMPPDLGEVAEVWPLIRARWSQLDPASRGFLLASIPASASPSLAELVEFAMRDPSPEVELGVLLGQVSTLGDPRLAAAIASGDPRIARIAELVRVRLVAASEAR